MKIFFLHNPKAGGTALRAFLSKLFPSESAAPVFDNCPYDHTYSINEYKNYVGYRFYAGHYGYDMYRKIATDHLLVTNFRDPTQRIKSLYRYWRQYDVSLIEAEAAGPVRIAQTHTFAEFIRHPDPDLRLYIDNFHFRQLLGSGWENGRSGPLARWLVRRRIRRMPWLFVSETSNLSIAILKRILPICRDIDLERVNENRDDDISLSAEDVRFITSCNLLDYEIYCYAVTLQAHRCAQHEGL